MFRRKVDPVAEAESKVATLTTREEKLRERLSAVESELADARARRRRDLIEGGGDDGPADGTVSVILSRVADLRDALGELVGQRQAAERRLGAAREAVERAKAADVMATTNADISRSLAAFKQSATDLLTALGAVTIGGRSVASQYRPFVEGMIGELDRMLADMQRRQVSVAAGSAPVPVIAPPSEPAPAPPPIERQRVFTLQQVLWTDEGLKTAIKFAMIDLPIETAKRALAAGAVLPLGDPRVGNIHDDWGNTGIRAHGPTLLPLAAHECRDLDEPIEEAAA